MREIYWLCLLYCKIVDRCTLELENVWYASTYTPKVECMKSPSHCSITVQSFAFKQRRRIRIAATSFVSAQPSRRLGMSHGHGRRHRQAT